MGEEKTANCNVCPPNGANCTEFLRTKILQCRHVMLSIAGAVFSLNYFLGSLEGYGDLKPGLQLLISKNFRAVGLEETLKPIQFQPTAMGDLSCCGQQLWWEYMPPC